MKDLLVDFQIDSRTYKFERDGKSFQMSLELVEALLDGQELLWHQMGYQFGDGRQAEFRMMMLDNFTPGETALIGSLFAKGVGEGLREFRAEAIDAPALEASEKK